MATVDMVTGEIITSDEDAIREKLMAPFPQQALLSRKGAGGKDFTYVSTATVIRRLNEATGNHWSFTVKHEATKFFPGGQRKDRNGNAINEQVMMVYGELTIPGLGTRGGYGVQRVDDPILFSDDLLKAAAGDALKRAAVSFGVAIELYGRDLEYGAESHAGTPDTSRRSSHTSGTPNAAPVAAQGRSRPSSKKPDSYPKVEGVRNTADLVEYMRENSLHATDFASAIKAARAYGKDVHGIDDIIIGSGEYDEKYRKNKVYPSDIADALGYWFSVEGEGKGTEDDGRAIAEVKDAVARDTKGEEDDFDDVPF